MTTDLELVETSPITEAQGVAVQAALDAALSPGTRAAYASSWKTWTEWCALNGHAPIPAQPMAMAAFLTDRAAGGRAVTTISKDLAAIRAEHERAGLEDPTAHRGVRQVMRGVRRQVGAAATKQAHPLTTPEIRRIVNAIDRGSLRGLRDRALILTGYAAALRRGELAGLHVSDLTFRSQGVVVNLRRSKSDQEGEGSLIGIVRGQHPETDPVSAVLAWIKAAELEGDDFLFQPVAWSDRRPLDRGMTGQSVAAVVTERAAAAGLGDLPVTGHSLRAGHATQASEAGVSATRLARTTRHANLSTLARYVRPAEVLGDSTSGELGL